MKPEKATPTRPLSSRRKTKGKTHVEIHDMKDPGVHYEFNLTCCDTH